MGCVEYSFMCEWVNWLLHIEIEWNDDKSLSDKIYRFNYFGTWIIHWACVIIIFLFNYYSNCNYFFIWMFHLYIFFPSWLKISALFSHVFQIRIITRHVKRHIDCDYFLTRWLMSCYDKKKQKHKKMIKKILKTKKKHSR